MYNNDVSNLRRERVIAFFKANLITLIIIVFLASLIISDTEQNILLILLFIGVFCGFKHMRTLIIARGFDLGTTIALVLIPFILGAMLGVFILAWRVLRAFIDLGMLISFLATSKTASAKIV